ncbi:uncharacterized protein JCM6883_005943 [Sporobolomyces salmoneus]|uniref:uncharacterized protein n=1 Tax=Sporobolomyces salmoneus TaxID=183962 RepID=UPI003170FD5A
MKEVERLSKEVPSALSEVKQLITSSCLWTLNNFGGSTDLMRVFVNDSSSTLRQLVVYRSPFSKCSAYTTLTWFPTLSQSKVSRVSLTWADSITITSGAFIDADSELPALPFASILVNLPWHWLDEVIDAESSIVNLPVLVSGIVSSTSARRCSTELTVLAFLLKDPRRFTRLESIYLPPSRSLVSEYHTIDVVASIRMVTLAAKDRNIEVVIEEQSEDLAAECQISEEFMRRMTQRRMAGTAAEGE